MDKRCIYEIGFMRDGRFFYFKVYATDIVDACSKAVTDLNVRFVSRDNYEIVSVKLLECVC